MTDDVYPGRRHQKVLRIGRKGFVRVLRWFPSHKIFLLWLFGFKTYLVRRRTKTQKYKGAVFEQLGERLGLARSVENETKQKTRQQNKTHVSKQGKQIINQNIRVLAPLDKLGFSEKNLVFLRKTWFFCRKTWFFCRKTWFF